MRVKQFIKYLIMISAGVPVFQANSQNPLFISDIGYKAYYSAYDSLLSKYQVNTTDHWLETKLGTIHLLEAGDREAPPVLLIPAAGCSAAAWYANLNELGKNYHVFALDIPGDAGKSVLRKQDRPILIQDYNLMILEILEILKLREVTLIGHSIGGFLATGFTISHPERVNKLVLLAPVATHINIRWYFRILLKMGGKPGKGPAAEKILKMQAYPGFEPEPLFVNLMQCVRDYCHVELLFPYVYPTDELSAIGVPTSLVIGSNEILCNYKRSIKKAKRKFGNIDVYLMDKTGHTPNMERPGAFNQILKSILSQ